VLINTFKIPSNNPEFSEELASHVLNGSIASWLYLAKLISKTRNPYFVFGGGFAMQGVASFQTEHGVMRKDNKKPCILYCSTDSIAYM